MFAAQGGTMQRFCRPIASGGQRIGLIIIGFFAMTGAGALPAAEPSLNCDPVPTYIAGTNGRLLVSINPATGQGTLISNAGFASFAASIAGLAYDPMTSTIYGSDLSSDALVKINPETGIAERVGSLGFDGVRDLTIHPVTGELYGLDSSVGRLLTINKATGAGTATALSGVACLTGLEFDPSTQILYATDTCADTLVVIELPAGPVTSVGPLGFGNVTGLAMDPIANQMYGVNVTTNQFLTVNLATGDADAVGTMGFTVIRSLAFDAAGRRMFAASADLDALLRIDTATGATTAVRRLGGDDFRGLAFDPQSMVLYGAEADSQRLFRIDPRNGDSTPIGSLGGSIVGSSLALHPITGVLYGTGRNDLDLIRLDKATGLATTIGPFGGDSAGGLAFDHAGVLYMTNSDGRDLFTVDTETGAATWVGPLGTTQITELAFDGSTQTLYGANEPGSRWVSIDRATGEATVLSNNSYDDLNGLTWVAGGILPECSQDFRYSLVMRQSPSTSDFGDLPAPDEQVNCTEPFYVEFWARDEGVVNSGVTCAFTDVLYDADSIQAVNITHAAFSDPVFASGQDDGAGRVVALGGCHLPAAPGEAVGVSPQWVCVARLQMMPTPPGCSRGCSSDPFMVKAQPAADTESSAFGRGIVLPADIKYGSADINLHCGCFYDLTGDCAVNAVDLGVIAPSWRKCAGDPAFDPRADFDCGGCFAGGDIGFLATAWLRDCSAPGIIFAACKGCGAGDTQGLSLADDASSGVEFGLRLAMDRTAADHLAGDLPLSVTSARAGERLFAEFWMRDLDSASLGLVAGFADLHFAAGEFRVVQREVNPVFGLLASGDEQSGRVLALGGATVATGGDPARWVRVATVELEALADSDAPQVWLRPNPLEPAARYGAGAVPAALIRVESSLPVFAAADFDRDGDIDQSDFGVLQRCFAVPSMTSDCAAADLNGDSRINAEDLASFQNCASGSAMRVQPGCGR